MRVRDWQDIVRDVVDADAEPSDWRAVAGPRDEGIGEDLFLAHPRRGVYFMKTYPKNPFELRGVGSRVARSLDDEIAEHLPIDTGARFGVREPVEDEETAKERATRLEQTVRTHADAPTTPDALFEDVMEAIESPAFGPLTVGSEGRPDEISALTDSFDEAQSILDAELEELIDEDGIGRGFD